MDNNDNTSIHDFDFNLICEYFSSISRQGPGSDEATLKALGFIDNLPDNCAIADIGCGTGSQAITLAKHLQCNITAIDLFPMFTEKLSERAKENGVEKKVETLVADMTALPFKDDAIFDIIWSEGAIYNIGFERGINEWRRLIKPHGWLAVTESTWLTGSRPDEIQQFWDDAYPLMTTVSGNIDMLQKTGYKLQACFVLPDKCWTDNFYVPQREAQSVFLANHCGNATAEMLVSNQLREAEMYDKYHDFYGYVFYIAQRTN